MAPFLARPGHASIAPGMTRRSLPLWLGATLGVALGLGLFTLAYAKGLSYASDAPEACVNCHVMRDQYDGWLAGPHHAVATCNDCHVPQDFFGKWLAKGLNGFHHSKAFTLQNF